MSLTPKQENFCVEYVKTGNGIAAYKAAYAAGKMSDTSIYKEVKSLMKNPQITPRIAELQAPAAIKAQITLESHLADLLDLRDRAKEEGKYAAAVGAEIARGKAVGIYIERVAVEMKIDIGDVDNRIAALMKKLSANGDRPKRA